MSNSKDIHCNPRLQDLGISWMAAMLCNVVRRRHWAHTPVIHATSHFYHEKRVAWISISMHACDPVPIVMGLRLAVLRAARAPLLYPTVTSEDVC